MGLHSFELLELLGGYYYLYYYYFSQSWWLDHSLPFHSHRALTSQPPPHLLDELLQPRSLSPRCLFKPAVTLSHV